MAGSSLRPHIAAAGVLRSPTPHSHQRTHINSAAGPAAAGGPATAAGPAAAAPAAAPVAAPAAAAATSPRAWLHTESHTSKSFSTDLRRREFPAWGAAAVQQEAEDGKDQQPSSSFFSSAPQQQQGGGRLFASAVNVSFSLVSCLILLFAVAAAGRTWLPPHHPLRSYADQLLIHAPRLGAFSFFRLTPVLQRAAAAASKDGHKALAEWLYAAADHPLTDAGFLLFFSLSLIFFFFFILRGLRAYKRERDVETCPPETMYCTNRMTAEEFANREATYKALANLMKDPEYLRMKGTRAAAGPAAWNWQLRARANPAELLQEELAATSGEE